MTEDPKLVVLRENAPRNILDRLTLLESQVESLQTSNTPQIEQIVNGRTMIFDLALSPVLGVTVTDPTNVGYTGGFITGNGLVFSGDRYVSGNVINGVLKTGFTDLGTLYATDAEIEGTIIIGTGSSAGGWFINSTQIFNASISLDSSIPAIKIGSATAIMTGAGIFMGNDAGTYKMRIGNPAGNYILWDGAVLTTTGQWITSQGVNPALQEWETNIVFSSASDVQVNWTSGTIRLSDATTYTISAGNTGTMSALTYIYLNTAVSLTVLQTTATYSTAVGDGKILVAAAQNATAGASVLPFAGQQPIINGAAQITALSIVAGNIAAGAITATKISVTSLSAITASMGSLTIDNKLTMSGASGAIAIGTTPPTSATVGTGLWIDRTGVYSLDTNVQQATLSSLGLSAAAGAVIIDVAGITIEADEYPPTTLVTFIADDDASLIASITPYYLVAGLQSGFISNGYAKGATYEGINYMFAWNNDSSSFASLQVGSQGDAKFDLKFGSVTTLGLKALTVETSYSNTNARVTMLKLDLYTSGTAAAGLGPAIELNAENASGTQKAVGVISARYTDATNASEDSEIVLERMVAGVLVGRVLNGYDTIFEYNANNIFQVSAADDSDFVATIASKSGSTLVYNAPSAGNENVIVPVSTSQLAKIRLYNTTRGTSLLISNNNAGTNTITFTAAVPAAWVAGDTITIRSQTNTDVSGASYFIDLELTSGPVGAAGLWLFIGFVEAAGQIFSLHPFEAFGASKNAYIVTESANQATRVYPVKLTSNVFCIRWTSSGTTTASVVLREVGNIM